MAEMVYVLNAALQLTVSSPRRLHLIGFLGHFIAREFCCFAETDRRFVGRGGVELMSSGNPIRLHIRMLR